MASVDSDDVVTSFPPGTIRLETRNNADIVLSPQPSSDPNDPLNWSTRRKCIQMSLLGLYAILIFAMLTLSVPLWTPMNEELGFTYAQLNDSYGASAVSLCFGCIFFVPFALRYGRRPVYLASTTLMLVTAIWSARIENLGDLMATNVLMGLSGAVNETLFQMTVPDLFFVHQRGTLNGLLLVFGTVGNYFGPVASGYCATTMGWRWPFWFSAIFLGVTIILLAVFLEESKYVPAPTEGIVVPTHDEDAHVGRTDAEKSLKDEKQAMSTPSGGARRDSATEIIGYSTTDNIQQRIVPIDSTIPLRSLRQRYALYTPSPPSSYSWPRHLYQPFLLIYHFPAVAFTSAIWAFCLSALSVVAVSQSDLLPLPPYNFSSAGVGLTNVPGAIGNILGTLWGGPVVDWYIVRASRRNGGVYEPEMRIHLFVLPAVVMVVGVFMYGLTIAEGKPWIINFVGAGFVAFGIGGAGDIVLTYLQDSYLDILPDSLVGVAFVRNIMATILVFALSPWFDGMGIYNSFILLGCIAIAFVLTAVPMVLYGKKFRAKSVEKYRYYGKRQFNTRFT